jgi:hypothetical protein
MEEGQAGKSLQRARGVLTALLMAAPAGAESFADAVAFVRKHTPVVVLAEGSGGARVAVCPDLQGRVMTSTASGDAGPSLGWVNKALLASGRKDPHFNAYGGEDRFWLGPEGGQFGLFFAKGQPFDLAHWFTPPAIDSEAYPVEAREASRITFRKRMAVTNYAGTRFEIELAREVRLLPAAEARARVGAGAGLAVVGFESVNRITNVGAAPWTRETGLVSVWILGMFEPTPATTVVVPFVPGPESALGPRVNDAYFGTVPKERLRVEDRVLYFRGDGQARGKIGIARPRARDVLGSYDAKGRVLTLVRFTLPAGATDYVNSMWQLQEQPYAGDVVNSYNDGPPGPGQKPLGPFYELETSSPAAALRPRESLTHSHLTLHLTGEAAALDAVARATLGVGLAEVEAAFAR